MKNRFKKDILALNCTICVSIFLFAISDCRADIPPKIVKRFKQIIKLIKEDKVNELAALTEYPLKRENPLPDIPNVSGFISYEHILFDDAFKKKILLYNDSVIFEHHGGYGLVGGPFDGDIWIDENGKITSVNYSSKKEIELRKKLTEKIQSQIYPGVNSWDENVLVARSENLLIRIDHTQKGIRYVSWSKQRPTSEKPDLILFDGVEEAEGTEGGWTWTFKNGEWTYIVDDVEMCETPKNCGLFLTLTFNGSTKSTIRLHEIK